MVTQYQRKELDQQMSEWNMCLRLHHLRTSSSCNLFLDWWLTMPNFFHHCHMSCIFWTVCCKKCSIEEEQKSFDAAKALVSDNQYLAYYDVSKPLKVLLRRYRKSYLVGHCNTDSQAVSEGQHSRLSSGSSAAWNVPSSLAWPDRFFCVCGGSEKRSSVTSIPFYPRFWRCWLVKTSQKSSVNKVRMMLFAGVASSSCISTRGLLRATVTIWWTFRR